MIPYVPRKPVAGGVLAICLWCPKRIFEPYEEFSDGLYREPNPLDEPIPPPYAVHWLAEHAPEGAT